MTDEEFDKYEKERYQKEIRWYDTRSRQNQWGYRATQIYSVAASVSIPVLLNIDDFNLLIISIIAASVAGVQSLSSLVKFQENWLNYRTTAETVRKEIHFLHAGVDEYGTVEDKRALFVKRVESLISRENTMWLIAAGQGDERKK